MANMDLTKIAFVELRRDLGILMELLVNDDTAAAKTLSAALLVDLDTLDTAIQAETNMTTLA